MIPSKKSREQPSKSAESTEEWKHQRGTKWPTEITMPKLLYKPWKIHTGLACLQNIHPCLKISPWSSQASPMEILGKKEGKIGKPNELEFWEIATILSPLSIYGDRRKTKIPLNVKLRYMPTKGTLGICLRTTIGRMPGDRTSRSLNASLAISTCVLRLEASRCAQIPSWFCGSTK
jgi:hypothetical protein